MFGIIDETTVKRHIVSEMIPSDTFHRTNEVLIQAEMSGYVSYDDYEKIVSQNKDVFVEIAESGKVSRCEFDSICLSKYVEKNDSGYEYHSYLNSGKVYFEDGREPYSFTVITSDRDMYDFIHGIRSEVVDEPINFNGKVDFIKENSQNDVFCNDDLRCLIRSEVENGYVSMEDVLRNDKLQPEIFMTFDFRDLRNENNETLLDVAKRIDYEYISELQEAGLLTKEQQNMFNSFVEKFREIDGENSVINKNLSIGDVPAFMVDKDRFFVNDEYSSIMSRDAFLNRFVVYADTDKSVDEIINSASDITLGNKIQAICEAGFDKEEVNKAVMLELQGIKPMGRIAHDNLKTWDDLINDGSVNKMLDYVDGKLNMVNILDKNGDSCLDAAVKAGELELSDKLIKSGALSKEDIALQKEQEKIKENINDNDNEL